MAAEWIGRPQLIVLDALAGFALLLLGLAAWSSRPSSGAGAVMATAGFTWFLGTIWAPAVLLHRGAIAHLLLTYPSGRLASGLERAAVGLGYGYAVVGPVAADEYATVAFAVGLVALSARRYVAARGSKRRARLAAFAAAAAFGVVLVLGAVSGLADVGADLGVLAAYDATACLIAVGLFADLGRGRRTQAAVTGLVVDLGEPMAAGTLRDKLARTLGDPTLVVGYWLPEEGRYVDEAGRPVELPVAGVGRAATPIEEDGRPVAALVHDVAVLNDPGLALAVAAATRLAVSNARLQAQVRARVVEVEVSRRRVVEAEAAQRRRLGRELREGAQRRLASVSELVSGLDPELERQLAAARVELDELGRGIHPATLSRGGLPGALQELGARSPVPVAVEASSARLPEDVEAAVYFVCSEALANVAKYARAARASVRVASAGDRVRVEVVDDGGGGASPAAGSGLRGLADRVEALGGRLQVESPPGAGTRLLAEIPLTSPSATASRGEGWVPRRGTRRAPA